MTLKNYHNLLHNDEVLIFLSPNTPSDSQGSYEVTDGGRCALGMNILTQEWLSVLLGWQVMV